VKRQMKNIAHPTDKTTNWCSHGGWFTLVKKTLVLLLPSPVQRATGGGWPLLTTLKKKNMSILTI